MLGTPPPTSMSLYPCSFTPLKLEQSQKLELEKRLKNELSLALEEINALKNQGTVEEILVLQKHLQINQEEIASLRLKCEGLEAELKTRELEYNEDMEETDSNLERLLKKYDDLSQKAILLETLYKKAQADS